MVNFPHMEDVNKRYNMRNVKLFFTVILLCCSAIIINVESQETLPIIWEKISSENATRLISVFEFQLETPINLSNSSIYIDNLYIVPNTPYLFISYKDRDTRQQLSPIWQIWNFQTQSLLFSKPALVENIAFSSDGKYFVILAKSQDKEIELCLWRVDGLSRINCWELGRALRYPFNKTNDLLAFAQVQEGKFEIIGWNISMNQEQFVISDTDRWAFNPQKPYEVVTANSTEISLWDIENMQKMMTYTLINDIIVSEITFDESGNFIFFSTLSFTDSKQRLVTLNLTSQEVTTTEGQVADLEIFSSPYAHLFPFRQEDPFILAWINPLINETVRLSEDPVLDTNLSQDLVIVIHNEYTFLVENLITEEIYATFPYLVDDIRYPAIRFTQDERFILAYTATGLVQLWGVPVENALQ